MSASSEEAAGVIRDEQEEEVTGEGQSEDAPQSEDTPQSEDATDTQEELGEEEEEGLVDLKAMADDYAKYLIVNSKQDVSLYSVVK